MMDFFEHARSLRQDDQRGRQRVQCLITKILNDANGSFQARYPFLHDRIAKFIEYVAYRLRKCLQVGRNEYPVRRTLRRWLHDIRWPKSVKDHFRHLCRVEVILEGKDDSARHPDSCFLQYFAREDLVERDSRR